MSWAQKVSWEEASSRNYAHFRSIRWPYPQPENGMIVGWINGDDHIGFSAGSQATWVVQPTA